MRVLSSIILTFFTIIAHLHSQTATIDSLWQRYQATSGKEKTEVLSRLAIFTLRENAEEGLALALRLDSVASEQKDTLYIIEALSIHAEYFWRKGELEDALVKGIEAVKLAESWNQDQNRLARAIQTVGTIHLFLENSDEALHYYGKCAPIYKELEIWQSYYGVINNIGVVYMDKAQLTGDSLFYDSTIYYAKEVVEAGEKAAKSTRKNAHGNLADVYLRLGNKQKALEEFKAWVLLEKEAPSLSNIANTYGTIARLYESLGDPKNALKYYQEGLSAAKETKLLFNLQEYYAGLTGLYQKQNNYKKALEYALLRNETRDSLYNQEKTKAVSELETKYQTEKKEQQIAQLEQENQIAQLEAEREKQLRLFFLVVAALLIVAIGTVYNRYRTKQKTNLLLDAKNQELSALNHTKDRLFSIISHDLKSPLSSFHTITKSLADNWDNIEKEQMKSFILSLRDSSKEVHDMMDNLLRWALSQTGQLAYKPQEVPLKQTVEEIRKQLETALQVQSISLQNQIDEISRIKADADYIKIILRNLISNSIKYSAPQKSIHISTESSEHATIISITDEGVGMKPEEVDKIFSSEGDAVHQIQNSANKGTGLGLRLCKELMEKMDGKIEISSAPQQGTTVKLIFPLAA